MILLWGHYWHSLIRPTSVNVDWSFVTYESLWSVEKGFGLTEKRSGKERHVKLPAGWRKGAGRSTHAENHSTALTSLSLPCGVRLQPLSACWAAGCWDARLAAEGKEMRWEIVTVAPDSWCPGPPCSDHRETLAGWGMPPKQGHETSCCKGREIESSKKSTLACGEPSACGWLWGSWQNHCYCLLFYSLLSVLFTIF